MNNNTEKPQEQKKPEPSAPTWTQDQLHYLARLAWKEMSHSPGFRSLPQERQTEIVTQRLQEMVASNHNWTLAYRQFPPTQPAAHNLRTIQPPANDSGEVPVARGKHDEPNEPAPRQKREYDPKRYANMSAREIREELLRSGLVTDDTQQGRGLEIFQTTQRHAHEYEGS